MKFFDKKALSEKSVITAQLTLVAIIGRYKLNTSCLKAFMKTSQVKSKYIRKITGKTKNLLLSTRVLKK